MVVTGFLAGLAAAGFSVGIVAGVAIVLWRRSSATDQQIRAEGPQTSFVFSGNLKQTSLIDAIQFLEIGKRQGILHIYCGRRKGYLTFVDGTVVDAFYRNRTGREAVFSMLDLEEGDFYFEPKTIEQPRLISDSIIDLAFEWDARKQ